MTGVWELLAEHPLFYFAIVIGVGASIGRLRVGGVSLGPAAVLFTAIAITAIASSAGVQIVLPTILGDLGLVLFAFTTGLVAGPAFFASLRSAWTLVCALTVVLVAAAASTFVIGSAFGLSATTIAGSFAGAVTNTPALAAAGGSAEATVGYASTYVFSVLLMLLMVAFAVRFGNDDPDTPPDVVDATVRVDCDDIAVGDLRERHGHRLMFSRLAHNSGGPAAHADDADVIRTGDLVTVVGPADEVDRLIEEIGHRSSHDLTADRRVLDFRRITISAPHLAGRRVRDLDIEHLDGAVTRVRRGDTDMVATENTVVQLGDRLRVVAPRDRMSQIAETLGDSARGLTELNVPALGFGVAVGLLIGMIPIPVPGLGSLSLGAAAGTLLMGLVMGRLGRVGRVPTSMPVTAAQVVSEIGLLLFLAFAGTKAGGLIITAFTSGAIVDILVTGAVTSVVMACGMYAVCRWVLRTGRIRLAGVLAGTQTNPAHLAFANARTGDDPRIALGYALVYPAAMVVKILLAQVLVIL